MDESISGPVSDEAIARERSRARELRRSQWWKNQLGRGRCHYYCSCLGARRSGDTRAEGWHV